MPHFLANTNRLLVEVVDQDDIVIPRQLPLGAPFVFEPKAYTARDRRPVNSSPPSHVVRLRRNISVLVSSKGILGARWTRVLRPFLAVSGGG